MLDERGCSKLDATMIEAVPRTVGMMKNQGRLGEMTPLKLRHSSASSKKDEECLKVAFAKSIV